MQTLITAAKASGDVILMSGVPSSTTQASQAAQQSFVTALQNLAVSNSVPMLDIWTSWYGASGGWTSNNALGEMYDTLHPNGRGYPDLENQAFLMLRAS